MPSPDGAACVATRSDSSRVPTNTRSTSRPEPQRRMSPKAFVDAKVALFQASEAKLLISPDRFIRTTDADHTLAAQEMVRRSFAAGDIYVGSYEGWYCPNEGFRNADDVVKEGDQTVCPNHPGIPLQWLTERNWFFKLSAYQERLEAWLTQEPSPVQPEYRRNEMLGFVRQGLEDFSISREGASWGIPFPIREDGSSALTASGEGDPKAGTIYVWYDALINYLTGAGFPADAAGAPWWPADLHIIGKDINRFHSVFWPAMLWSAGLDAPKKIWVHGWLLSSGERMSKSRGNFLDPDDAVAALGADGTRFVALREVPFDRDGDVSWDSIIRRYNSELANDFGNLVNRATTLASRAFTEGPLPRAAAASPSARPGKRRAARQLPHLNAMHCMSGSAHFGVLLERPISLSIPRSRGSWPRLQSWVMPPLRRGCAACSATFSRRVASSRSMQHRRCQRSRRKSGRCSVAPGRTMRTGTTARRSTRLALGVHSVSPVRSERQNRSSHD